MEKRELGRSGVRIVPFRGLLGATELVLGQETLALLNQASV